MDADHVSKQKQPKKTKKQNLGSREWLESRDWVQHKQHMCLVPRGRAPFGQHQETRPLHDAEGDAEGSRKESKSNLEMEGSYWGELLKFKFIIQNLRYSRHDFNNIIHTLHNWINHFELHINVYFLIIIHKWCKNNNNQGNEFLPVLLQQDRRILFLCRMLKIWLQIYFL